MLERVTRSMMTTQSLQVLSAKTAVDLQKMQGYLIGGGGQVLPSGAVRVNLRMTCTRLSR